MLDSGQDNSVHPGLRNTLRAAKAALIAAWAALGGLIGLALAMLLYFAPQDRPALVIFLAALPLFPFVGALIHFLRKFKNGVHRADRLLQTRAGEPVIIEPTGYTDFFGIYLRLGQAEAPENQAPLGTAVVHSTRRRPLAEGTLEGMAFVDHESPERWTALETTEALFWGRLTDRAAREALWRKTRRFILALSALVLLTAGVLGGVLWAQLQWAKAELALAEKSLNWPAAEGRIVKSELLPVRIRKGKGSIPGFRAEILYSYSSGENELEGGLIHFGYRPTPDRTPAAELVDKYPPDRAVKVFFQPDHPKLAVLEPGHVQECRRLYRKELRSLYGLGAATAAGAAIIAGLLFLMNRRRKRKLGD